MRAPRAKKPDSVTETSRVLTIYDWLIEGLSTGRFKSIIEFNKQFDPMRVLEVAERIAARTTDGDST